MPPCLEHKAVDIQATKSAFDEPLLFQDLCERERLFRRLKTGARVRLESLGNDILTDASKLFAFEDRARGDGGKAGVASNGKLRGASNSFTLDKMDDLR